MAVAESSLAQFLRGVTAWRLIVGPAHPRNRHTQEVTTEAIPLRVISAKSSPF
jgi:hypothetical protein